MDWGQVYSGSWTNYAEQHVTYITIVNNLIMILGSSRPNGAAMALLPEVYRKNLL